MLSALTRTFRVKAAVVVAAFYALCSLAPSAAIAFAATPGVIHCLIEDHVGIHNHGGDAGMHAGDKAHVQAKAHIHAEGAAHQHHGDTAAPPPSADHGKPGAATCCGLFSIVALAGEAGPSLGLYRPASVILATLDETLSGRGPERIIRPPIA